MFVPRLSLAKDGVFYLHMIAFAYILLILAAVTGSVPFASLPVDGHYDSTNVTVRTLTDSVSSDDYTLDEILVMGTRLPQTAGLSASPVSVVGKAELVRTNGVSLADVLSSLPGIFIKNYGGISGLKTIAQRGLGAEHTVVLLNGMRVSNIQNGVVDLGLIGIDELERLEVLHGGQSASFGADAVAGIVNAVTAVQDDDHVTATSSIGSFGYQRYSIGIGGKVTDALSARATYRAEHGDEDYPFLFRNGEQRFELVRHNADFTSRSGTLRSHLQIDDDLHLSLFGRTFTSERGVGGPVVGPASMSVARQKDDDHLLQLMVKSDHVPFGFHIGMQLHSSYQRYQDRAFIVGASALDNFSTILDFRIEPGVLYTFSAATRVALGGEFAYSRGMGNVLASHLQRATSAFYIAAQQRMTDQSDLVEGVWLYPSLRYDVIRTGTETLMSWSPQLGAVCAFREIGGVVSPTLRTNVSRNFRAPTFNELSYAGGGGIGNPHLQPERATNVDVGLDVVMALFGKHLLQVSYFDIAMRDRIVWVSAGGFGVTPKNLRHVRTNGIELTYRWQVFNEQLSVGINYTSLTARKTEGDSPSDHNPRAHLIYVPQEEAQYTAAYRLVLKDDVFREVGAAFSVAYVGFRYTSEDNQNVLPSYAVAEMNLRVHLAIAGLAAVVRFDVNNLFNKEYHSVPGYPMPLRSYRAACSLTF